MRLFDLNLRPAKCWSSCSVGLEGVDRRNVTWCIRLADVNSYIETCVSLDENDELVFQRSCNDSAFDIENHLSLPTVSHCHNVYTVISTVCSVASRRKVAVSLVFLDALVSPISTGSSKTHT